jgi:hypothetical protein
MRAAVPFCAARSVLINDNLADSAFERWPRWEARGVAGGEQRARLVG